MVVKFTVLRGAPLFPDLEPEATPTATGSAAPGLRLTAARRQCYNDLLDGDTNEILFLSPSPSAGPRQHCRSDAVKHGVRSIHLKYGNMMSAGKENHQNQSQCRNLGVRCAKVETEIETEKEDENKQKVRQSKI